MLELIDALGETKRKRNNGCVRLTRGMYFRNKEMVVNLQLDYYRSLLKHGLYYETLLL